MKIETKLSLLSTGIALAALVLTLRQMNKSDQITKLQLRPHIEMVYHHAKGSDKYGFRVLNEGLGPALIDSWKLYVDGGEISQPQSWFTALELVGIPNGRLNTENFIVRNMPSPTVINPGKDLYILEIKLDSLENQELTFEEFKSMERISIELEYSSMLKEKLYFRYEPGNKPAWIRERD